MEGPNNSNSPVTEETASCCNLIVKDLPQHYNNRCLYSTFITAGKVASSQIIRYFRTGYSYAFGFVEYTNPEDAKLAIERFNGLEIFGKRIKVSYDRPASESIKNTDVYICNIPRHYKKEDLINLFEKYGTIIHCYLLHEKLTGMFVGEAFVRYSLQKEAQAAIEGLDKQVPPGGEEQLIVMEEEEEELARREEPTSPATWIEYNLREKQVTKKS